MNSFKMCMAAVMMAVLPVAVAQPVMAAAPASAAPGVSFGILDLDRVMQKSVAAEAIMKELNAKRKEYEDQIAKEEKALLQSKDAIMAQRDKMNEADFNKKREEFEKKFANAKKMVQERKQTLDSAFSDTMRKLREETLKITAEIARDRKFDVVFSDDSIVLAESAYDITDEVLARVNKDVKKIAVVWPAKKK